MRIFRRGLRASLVLGTERCFSNGLWGHWVEGHPMILPTIMSLFLFIIVVPHIFLFWSVPCCIRGSLWVFPTSPNILVWQMVKVSLTWSLRSILGVLPPFLISLHWKGRERLLVKIWVLSITYYQSFHSIPIHRSVSLVQWWLLEGFASLLIGSNCRVCWGYSRE